MFNIFLSYISKNKTLAFIGSYFLFSSILKAITDIDICIPCLWHSIFGIHCPGCGLTTAFINLIKLDFNKAFESNWLIFIIVPFGIFYLTKDYFNYNRKYKGVNE